MPLQLRPLPLAPQWLISPCQESRACVWAKLLWSAWKAVLCVNHDVIREGHPNPGCALHYVTTKVPWLWIMVLSLKLTFFFIGNKRGQELWWSLNNLHLATSWCSLDKGLHLSFLPLFLFPSPALTLLLSLSSLSIYSCFSVVQSRWIMFWIYFRT